MIKRGNRYLQLLCIIMGFLGLYIANSFGETVESLFKIRAKDPLEPYWEFLRQKNWIPFYVPSNRFSPATIILPVSQDIKLDQGSCFPALKIAPAKTALLEEIERGGEFSAETGVSFLRLLFGSGRVSFGEIKTANIAFSDIRHVATDIKNLSDSFSKECVAFLELLRDPVVISEMLEGRIAVTFKKSDGGKLQLDAKKLKQLFDMRAKVAFEIMDNTTLVTKKPLYFAFKAVKPMKKGDRWLFVESPLDELKPNYFAIWEHRIPQVTYTSKGRPEDLL